MNRRDFVRSGGAVLAAALPSASFRSRAPAAWIPQPAFLDQLPELMEVAAVPGVTMASIAAGELVWSSAYGTASLATGAPVSADTLFEVASCGKPVLAYLAMILCERGMLDLDRPLRDYVQLEELQNSFSLRITPRHLLTHTAGLPNWRTSAGLLELAREPGDRFAYSGEGYFIAQRLIEAVTDQPFELFIRDTVFRPLGMTDSTFVWTPALDLELAAGHLGLSRPVPSENYAVLARKLNDVAERWGKPVEQWRYADMQRAVPEADPTWPTLPTRMMPNAAGSLFSTAPDYARFVAAMLGAPRGGPLSDARSREMLRSEVALNPALFWGLGWGLERQGTRSWFWHWGNNDVFRCFAIGEPATRRGLVVLTNSSNGHKLYRRIVAAATGEEFAALLWFRT